MAEDSSNPYRLPRMVVPRRYELRLEPDLEAFSFAGTVGVDIDVVEPVGEIVLNAAELEISGGDLGGVALAGIDYDGEHERGGVAAGRAGVAGASQIELELHRDAK